MKLVFRLASIVVREFVSVGKTKLRNDITTILLPVFHGCENGGARGEGIKYTNGNGQMIAALSVERCKFKQTVANVLPGFSWVFQGGQGWYSPPPKNMWLSFSVALRLMKLKALGKRRWLMANGPWKRA